MSKVKHQLISRYLPKKQFDSEIQKGFSDFENGSTFTAEQVQAQLLKHRNDN